MRTTRLRLQVGMEYWREEDGGKEEGGNLMVTANGKGGRVAAGGYRPYPAFLQESRQPTQILATPPFQSHTTFHPRCPTHLVPRPVLARTPLFFRMIVQLDAPPSPRKSLII